MKHRLPTIIFSVALLLAVACTSHSGDVPDRPGEDPKVDPVVSDPAMRISGSVLNLNYDDGGVLFSKSADGRVISGVRLSDGIGFDFDTEAPAMRINGVDIALSYAELVERRGSTEWYRLTLADKKSRVYIVVDL